MSGYTCKALVTLSKAANVDGIQRWSNASAQHAEPVSQWWQRTQ